MKPVTDDACGNPPQQWDLLQHAHGPREMKRMPGVEGLLHNAILDEGLKSLSVADRRFPLLLNRCQMRSRDLAR